MTKEITIQTVINAQVNKVWKCYTLPEHIVRWNNASPDWNSPSAKNDLRVGGKFVYRMEARDGSEGFDFSGFYNEVKKSELITYTMDDGRKSRVEFSKVENKTKVVVTFDAEEVNSIELQRSGWQAILNNFKKYVESC